MAKTRTGSFPIGFRRGWTDWQKKDLGALAKWAKAQDFEAIDLGDVKAEDIKTLGANGLKIGSADLLDFGNIMATDDGKRKDVIAKNVAYVKEASAAGAKIFFTCIIPGDPSKKRSDNYKLAVECYSPIAQAMRFKAVRCWRLKAGPAAARTSAISAARPKLAVHF